MPTIAPRTYCRLCNDETEVEGVDKEDIRLAGNECVTRTLSSHVHLAMKAQATKAKYRFTDANYLDIVRVARRPVFVLR